MKYTLFSLLILKLWVKNPTYQKSHRTLNLNRYSSTFYHYLKLVLLSKNLKHMLNNRMNSQAMDRERLKMRDLVHRDILAKMHLYIYVFSISAIHYTQYSSQPHDVVSFLRYRQTHQLRSSDPKPIPATRNAPAPPLSQQHIHAQLARIVSGWKFLPGWLSERNNAAETKWCVRALSQRAQASIYIEFHLMQPPLGINRPNIIRLALGARGWFFAPLHTASRHRRQHNVK
jgi:hypothetical protein